jgi:hypothetical protein
MVSPIARFANQRDSSRLIFLDALAFVVNQAEVDTGRQLSPITDHLSALLIGNEPSSLLDLAFLMDRVYPLRAAVNGSRPITS